ncbi:MAG: MFS transporter [Desulfuromonadales bacterium]|nr:MFS transporter [Desulfuromonadales bacterium]
MSLSGRLLQTLTTCARGIGRGTVGYLAFFRASPHTLTFGLLLTLFSSFGQTFLISIFVPQLLADFALDTGRFGLLYAAATLTSAACLPWCGRLLDSLSLRLFSLATGLGLASACFAMALSTSTAGLFLALLGLRLAGQGLLTLTASTAMARLFSRERGRALSLAGLGYPLGEGLFPLAVVLLIRSCGWRLSWALIGGLVCLVLLPAMLWLLRSVPHGQRTPLGRSGRERSRISLLRNRNFYLVLPGYLFLPLVLTALFLYQVPLAESRGWTVEVMATGFIGFAAARLTGSVLIGPWIDRFGAVRLFPLLLLPICAGLIALSLGTSPLTALFYLTLAGVSQGIAMPTMAALWAEIYGVESLGAIKGTVSTVAIFSTALGPVLLGGLLQAGVPFAVIIPALGVVGLLIVAFSMLVATRIAAVVSHE